MRRGVRRAGLAALALAAAVTVSRRRGRPHAHGSHGACPTGLRWLLDLPRPWLTVAGLLDVLRPAPGERILEVGPGPGHYTLPVARALAPAGTVDALDLQQGMLDELERRVRRRAVTGVRAQCGDAARLPYPDAAFDAAYTVLALHEVPDRAAALRELRRVVRPHGRVVVGEMTFLPTPDPVRPGALIGQAEAAGLRLQRRSGPAFAFYARFEVAPPSDPAPG